MEAKAPTGDELMELMDRLREKLAGRDWWEIPSDERLELAEAGRLVWAAFAVEYQALFKKYDMVDLDWGCGCCSHGHSIAGIPTGEGPTPWASLYS